MSMFERLLAQAQANGSMTWEALAVILLVFSELFLFAVAIEVAMRLRNLDDGWPKTYARESAKAKKFAHSIISGAFPATMIIGIYFGVFVGRWWVMASIAVGILAAVGMVALVLAIIACVYTLAMATLIVDAISRYTWDRIVEWTEPLWRPIKRWRTRRRDREKPIPIRLDDLQ